MAQPPTRIDPPYRVFVSVPLNLNLLPNEQDFKRGFYDLLRQDGFEPQCFGEVGLPLSSTRWTIDEVRNVMARCQGAAVIGFPRWSAVGRDDWHANLITEYSHCEGTVAQMLNLPLLRIRPGHVVERGILDSSAFLTYIPPDADASYLQDPQFQQHYTAWRGQIEKRYHVFLGYCSKAEDVAKRLAKALEKKGVKVMDWQEFPPAGTILGEIERAENLCLGGIFLFMKDDDVISSGINYAAPRDNVIFEAGYFINAKGAPRNLIIREEGAKMPADTGGHIYLELKNRNDIRPIMDKVMQFIHDRL